MTLASRTRAFLLLLVAALALAACADDVEEAADEPDDTTEDAEDDEPDDEPADDADGDADGEPAALEANLTDRCAEEDEADLDLFPEQASFEHAERVDVRYHDHYKVVEVTTTFTDEPVTFVLLQCGAEPPELDGDLAEAPVIEVPVEEAVTLTTVNVAHFDALDAVDRLVGVGTTDFVTTASVRERIDAGEVEGYGTPEGPPDAERLIAASPDVAVLDAFGDSVLDDVALLGDAEVDVLLNADFDEPAPLGRAEWLKVTALLLNREADAEALFDEIAAEYDAVVAAVADVEDRPRVLLDEPFEGTWFAPGGESLTATLIDDAGGDYVFADDDATGSLAFDIETVLDEGADADVWLLGSVMASFEELLAQDERLTEIAAVGDDAVWAGDAGTSPEGGNPRFERAPLRADELLADVATILHPDLVEHELRYYRPVGEGAQ